MKLNHFLPKFFITMVSIGFDKYQTFHVALSNSSYLIIFSLKKSNFCTFKNAVAFNSAHVTPFYRHPSGTKYGLLLYWNIHSNQHSRIYCSMDRKSPPI